MGAVGRGFSEKLNAPQGICAQVTGAPEIRRHAADDRELAESTGGIQVNWAAGMVFIPGHTGKHLVQRLQRHAFAMGILRSELAVFRGA